MKQTLLIFALLFCLKSQGQTIKLDTAAKMLYAEINPITVGFMGGHSIERLYIKNSSFNIVDGATFTYSLYYINYRADSTKYYLPIGGTGQGERTLLFSDTTTIRGIAYGMFIYVRDSLLNITYK